MTDKVLYFIAGNVPTVSELADIALLNAAAEPVYEIGVRSNLQPAEYGVDRLEPAVYVAGTVPETFTDAVDENDDPIYTEIDPENLPDGGGDLEPTDAIVSNGGSVTVTHNNGGTPRTGTVAVADNAVTGITLPVSVTTIANSNAVQIRNSAGANAKAGTAVVAATGVFTGVNLPAASAIVDNNQSIPITGGTVVLTVANGVITGGTFTAE